MTEGQVSLQVLLFSVAIIFLSMLHIHLYLHIAIARRTNEESPGKFLKGNVLPEIGEHRVEKRFHFFSL